MQLLKTHSINSSEIPGNGFFRPSKPVFKILDLADQPYGPADFVKMAVNAIEKFHSKPAWLPYYEPCLALRKTDRLGAIHRAMSTAVICELNQSIENVGEFYSNPYQIVYEHVFPMVDKSISFCPEFSLFTFDRFVACLKEQMIIHHSAIFSGANFNSYL